MRRPRRSVSHCSTYRLASANVATRASERSDSRRQT
jgi:hypothetical protein